jgi:hypothetical protein
LRIVPASGRRSPRFHVVILSCAVALATGAAPARAKNYSAERFDSVIRVLPGGAIDVTETVVFRFEEGAFSYVYRDIPTRRTDGVEVLGASMDGRSLPFGSGPDHVEVSGRNRVRVRWRFAPVSSSSHTFVLNYVARGVVRREDGADVLHWRALPSEHDYRIDSSRIALEYPETVRAAGPQLSTRRAGDTSIEALAGGVAVSASAIGRNGWIEIRMPFASGTFAAVPPAWQERQRRQAELAPRWLTAAAVVFLAGMIVFFALRQRYDSPPGDIVPSGPVHDPPDDLPAGLAGALAANGSVTLEHAMAALFALADRGEISIVEEPRGTFGQRHFTLKRLRRMLRLAPFEERLLEVAFRNRHQEPETVSLSKARSRLTSRLRPFSTAIKTDLLERGLLDPDRQRVRASYGHVSLTMLLIAGAGFLGAAVLARQFGPWPLAVPAALLVVSLIGFIVQSATTPLTDEGIRQAERWRAYRKHLKDVAQSRVHASSEAASGSLAIAVALGLAAAWSKFLKQQPSGIPPWFQAVSAADDTGFPAFVAAGGSGATSGGGASGGAGGGGASGAG